MPIRRRGGVWWIDLSLKGRPRVRVSAGKGTTREQALELEAKLRSDHHAGRVGRAQSHTISEGFARWLNGEARALKSYQDILYKITAWKKFIKGRDLRDSATAAETAISAWLKAGLDVITVNRRLAALRRVLRLASEEWGWLDKPIKVRLLPGERPRTVQLTAKQAQKLLEVCEPHLKDCVLLAAHTGLRRGELLRLVPENYRRGRIVLGTDTKTGLPRSIPLSAEARRIASRLPLKIGDSELRVEFDKAKIRAGMPWLQFRDLRRTFGSWIVQKTGSLKAAQQLLGHSDIAITSRHYAHLLDKHLEEAIETLPNLARFGTGKNAKR